MASILVVVAAIALMTAPSKSLSASAEPGNDPKLIALESQQAPLEIGGTYSKIGAATIDDVGDVAFIATLSDSAANSAIFIRTAENIRPLLRAGEPTPEGGKYKNFIELDLARFTWLGVEGIFLLFRAELDESASTEGIFLWTPEKVEAIALSGAKSPRGSTYKSFSRPIISATSGNTGVNFFLAFIAVMDGDNKSIIQKSSQSGLEEVLATDDRLGGNVVKDFAISQMGAFAIGCVAEIRPKGGGKRYSEVLIVGAGYIINGGDLADGTRFKGFGKVKRIFSPPAIAFQVSFVALQFKDQSSAIAVRDVFGKPEILVTSGSVAPGLPDETIQSFDPPVTNARMPIAGPQAVVSNVRLSSGRIALWAHIFRFGGVGAETKLLHIEGSPSDGQSLQLRSVIPLKINNTGTMLIRATLGEAVDAHEGVFVMNGLF